MNEQKQPLATASIVGAVLIEAERARQIEKEGWTRDHDDKHIYGELHQAAICYVRAASIVEGVNYSPQTALVCIRDSGKWPWGISWLKISPDPVRNLVKAGALYTAEAERLERAGAPTPQIRAIRESVDWCISRINEHLRKQWESSTNANPMNRPSEAGAVLPVERVSALRFILRGVDVHSPWGNMEPDGDESGRGPDIATSDVYAMVATQEAEDSWRYDKTEVATFHDEYRCVEEASFVVAFQPSVAKELLDSHELLRTQRDELLPFLELLQTYASGNYNEGFSVHFSLSGEQMKSLNETVAKVTPPASLGQSEEVGDGN